MNFAKHISMTSVQIVQSQLFDQFPVSTLPNAQNQSNELTPSITTQRAHATILEEADNINGMVYVHSSCKNSQYG